MNYRSIDDNYTLTKIYAIKTIQMLQMYFHSGPLQEKKYSILNGCVSSSDIFHLLQDCIVTFISGGMRLGRQVLHTNTKILGRCF